MRNSSRPLILEANQPERPYRGGAGIAAFRGVPETGDYVPEDFLASTTVIYGEREFGLSRLPAGGLLTDAITEDPVGYLGPDHVRAFGADPRLLVKLLDTAERLFVHCHPSDEFAQTVLARAHGKTEAWVVIGAASDGAAAYLGFREDIPVESVERWVEQQDSESMLGHLHRVPLGVGDTLYVPAGLPHAIDPGLTLVELQQPLDLSILLEYEGYPKVDPSTAFLGLSRAEALAALDRRGHRRDEIAALRGAVSDLHGEQPLLPPASRRYFRASSILTSTELHLDREFSVLVLTTGAGELRWDGGTLAVAAGVSVLVPFGAGPTSLRGDVAGIRCRPPRPA